jgi:WD40 repeat protein
VSLYNNTQSTSSNLPISALLKYTSFHPTRPYFLAITATGDITCYSITSKRPSHTFEIKATTAVWWGNKVLVACEDLSIKILDFEAKTILHEFQTSAPATSLWMGEGQLIVGLKTGRCEVWNISESMRCKKVSEATIGRGGSPILYVAWVFSLSMMLT